MYWVLASDAEYTVEMDVTDLKGKGNHDRHLDRNYNAVKSNEAWR